MEVNSPYKDMVERFGPEDPVLKSMKDWNPRDPLCFTPAMLKQRAMIFDRYMKDQLPENLDYKTKTTTSTTQFVASVMKGKEKEVIDQVLAFLKKYRIGLRGAQIPTIDKSGMLRLDTTQELAPHLDTWLQDPRVQGRGDDEIYIMDSKNPWLTGGREVKGREGAKCNWSTVNDLGISVHPEQAAAHTKTLFDRYMKSITKDGDGKGGKDTFSLEGFDKFVQEQAKPGKGRTNESLALTQSVAANIKNKKDEFTQTAREQYIQLIRDILQGKSGGRNQFNWAVEQFKSAEYKFGELNEKGEPTELHFRGELGIGGGNVDIASFKFLGDMQDVSKDDIKDVSSTKVATNRENKPLDREPGAEFVTKINEDASNLCSRAQEDLGFKKTKGKETTKLDDNVWHDLTGQKGGIEMFRAVMLMLRKSAKVSEQAVGKNETKKAEMQPMQRPTDIQHYADIERRA